MEEYVAVYKCRLCGEKCKGGITGEEIAMQVSSHMRMRLEGEYNMYEKAIHSCSDGSIGYADFCGFMKREHGKN